jgi:hypothetical protein
LPRGAAIRTLRAMNANSDGMSAGMLPDLEGRDARDTLRWAFERYGERLAISTAFGPSGMVVLHLAAEINPAVRAFFLDTGYHFPETLAMVDRVRDRLGLNVEVVRPDQAVLLAEDPPEQTPRLFERNGDRCCEIRKVDPTRIVLRDLDAWVAALRRDQGPSRANTPVLELKENEGRPHRQGQPARRLGPQGRVEPHLPARPALQPPARPGLPQRRLRPVHPRRRRHHGRARRPLGEPVRPRRSAGCTRRSEGGARAHRGDSAARPGATPAPDPMPHKARMPSTTTTACRHDGRRQLGRGADVHLAR